MGQEITHWRFTEADRQRFVERLRDETERLGAWEKNGLFSADMRTAGYELEACLVNSDYLPADANDDFLKHLAQPDVVPELARCNIEFNGKPQELAGDGLERLHRQLNQSLKAGRDVATALGLRIILAGILPSLNEEDLCLGHISPSNRYYAINQSLAELRGHDYVDMEIRGRPTSTALSRRVYRGRFDSIMAESATTSFQLHLRLPPHTSAHWYNAALLASAPVLAVSANSPFLFGHDLWAETRIPVFAQSVDTGRYHFVSFGQGMLNARMSELFDRNLHHFPPLLPVEMQVAGLPHLKLHNGTIWRWNRGILDGDDDCEDLHYRLEHRSLPSGPTTVDMIANAAFFWGLVSALSEQPQILTFRQMRRNFYRSARDGMAARLLWTDGREYAVRKLLREQLLPMARQGLQALNVNGPLIQEYLEIIRQRGARGLSGSGWQRAWIRRHGHDMQALLEVYEKNQWSGNPVGEWEL